MIRTSFNDGWQVRPAVNPFAELTGTANGYRPVALPHDAMIGQERTDSPEVGATAFFPGGVFEYRKSFFVPEEQRGERLLLEFEGVYRDATVHINGDHAGQRPYGYSRFLIDAGRFLRYGQENEIRVEARSHQDSRWYTGTGIYRDTWLLTGGLVRIAPYGVRVTTPDIDAERAVVEVATRLENDSITNRTVRVRTELRDPAGVLVESGVSTATVLPGEPATVRRRLYVRDPARWSPDAPALYTVDVTVTDEDDTTLDADASSFGIRSLQLDPVHGLRINGETVNLRGACIHHDNGILGAATFAYAEERRVQILKDAGFNALRMSHHPMSIAMLDACDRIGMLVLDEAFDMWATGKSGFDYSLSFADWWERDVESMVDKDFNHPSVIMYSIGNEIIDAGTPGGSARGRRIAEKIRTLDGTRPVTNGLNGLVAVMTEVVAARRQDPELTGADDLGLNTLMADIGDGMNEIAVSELVTRRLGESFDALDVVGMNYMDGRYALDQELFPGRLILGTETFPTRIDTNWRMVKQYSHVIGDFTWTGWDYLGEIGLGRAQHLTPENPDPDRTVPYPYLLAGSGDIDITGHRRAPSYYREIVFGLRDQPYLTVRNPEHHGTTFRGSPWAWSESLASWTWPGFEGKPVTVEVYSDAEEVELLSDGRSLGRKPVGEDHRMRTEFDTVYRPGELTAVAYRGGVETGRTTLRSATGPVLLTVEAEREVVGSGHGDLAYVAVTLTDAIGTLYTGTDREVDLEVSGDGVLIGFGTAVPSTEERFDATARRTYQGRALAAVRPTGPGKIRLVATAPDCSPAEVEIAVE